jgi:hypothetical protein
MRSPTSKTPSKERVPRRRVEEALLEDRLRLNDEWVERLEEGGKCVEESLAPDGLPPFIRAALGRDKVYDVEGHLKRLVAAGCRRPVLYFCLEQLSPKAVAAREGKRWRSVPREDGEFDLLAEPMEGRPLATREDMEAARKKVEAARRVIHRHQRELLLVADTNEFRLPSGMPTVPEGADDAFWLLNESLSWVSSLAEAYTAPFAKTLLKSKGLLYLTAYVLAHADIRETRGRRGDGVDTALAGLASMVSGRKWSPSDLREKLRKFEKDHERLYKLLVHKLDELHRFHARR